jgi:ABC-2 type transport system permease protein
MRPRVILRLATREVRALFDAAGGPLVVGIFWLVSSYILVAHFYQFRAATIELAQSGRLHQGAVGIHVNDAVVRPFLLNLGSILVFFVPLLTMRSFAEERRSGGLELLLSQPLRGVEVLLGKFLGAALSLAACLAILVPQGVALAFVSRPDWGAAFTGVLGLLCVAGLFLAVGILVSIFSRSQVEAAVLGLGALLAAVIGPGAIRPSGPRGEAFVEFISVMSRFQDFARGVVDPAHLLFLGGLTLVVLAVGLRCLDLVRWQG